MDKSNLTNPNEILNKTIFSADTESRDEADDMLLSDLGMSERTRNILYRNNIDTVRELITHSEYQVASFTYMDKQALRELKTILSVLKIGFRSEKIDPFLYRYPRRIRQIIKDKPDYWEYLFFMELIKKKYQWLQPLRKRHLEPGKPKLAVPRITDLSVLNDLIQKNFEIVEGYVEDLAGQLNDHKDEAFGSPREPGNPEKIYLIADNMMKIYKKTILWMEDFRSVDTSREYRNAVLSFANLGEEICAFYDTLYYNCVEGIESVNDYLDGMISEEEVEIHLELELKLSEEPVKELVRLLKEEVERRSK